MAATIETVSRVGPCEAEIKLLEISDVRETKRKQIIERAAELLKEWDSKSMESSEIEEKIDTDIKLGEIISWGPDELPAGPDIDSSDEIIIVEGRADVLNLLRIGVKNTVAVQGTQIPKSIIELTNNKSTITAFLDGDRGGTIILNELLQVAKLDYIARAPNGYEVEELTRKQLIKALQNKKQVNEYSESGEDYVEKKTSTVEHEELIKILKKLKIKEKYYDNVIKAIENIEDSYSIGFDKSFNKTFEMPVGDLFENIKNYKETNYLIIDGILTNRLLSISMNINIKFIACKNKEEDLKIPEKVAIYFF
ncbi:MAG: toprim domain-containing protein [Promethearchaeota archaeon]|nr:MAG: toprim domain-containing protein [Candidatus Lokiarchaeota archaeon]